MEALLKSCQKSSAFLKIKLRDLIKWISFYCTTDELISIDVERRVVFRKRKEISFCRVGNDIFQVTDELRNERLTFLNARRASKYFLGTHRVFDALIERYFRGGVEDVGALVRNAVVVDVGANIGEFSKGCLRLGATKVICVEADSDVFYCLCKNLSQEPRAILKNIAASSDRKSVAFYKAGSTADSSLIQPLGPSKEVLVEADKLGSIVAPHICRSDKLILKIEAEGAEPEVLLGARELIESHKDIFITVRASAERRGEDTVEACVNILESFGLSPRIGGLGGYQVWASKD